MLYTQLRFDLSGLFPSGFITNSRYTFIYLPISATYPANLVIPYLIILIILGVEYNSRRSSIFGFLHAPITSTLLGPYVLLSALFSNTLKLCSSLNVREHVSHTYGITVKIIVLKDGVFWDVRPCRSCKNPRFGGT
jgi:hypothetical protein